ncbi:3-keto-5-aminohexanoate cleavage protein [Methylorubrum podarium]|uniref:3-keto-5-aminohexanoate cleavage protein n=1 Tax=Methylorubrum podarium TaxID=200476 RepID=A0ABV1QSH4_9HYPH
MTQDAGWPPLILANAPNGATRTRADHPALPITEREIARTAAEVAEAGAALIHVHVRDAQGRHLLDAEAYRAVTAAIRAEVGDRLVVQITSEAAGRYQGPEQMAVVRATRPEAVSLALREIVPDAAAEAEAAAFFAWARAERVRLQVILYAPDEVTRYADLKARGVLGEGGDFPLFVLGRYTPGQVSRPADLLPFLATAGERLPLWAICAFGPRENACALAAAALGGHVRVGFENSLLAPDGRPAESNAAQIRRAAEGAALLGRPLADADTARAMMA